MYRIAVPYPTAAGKTESDIRAISDYLSAHPDEYRQSRGRLGGTMERAYVQATPMGLVTIAYLEGDQDFARAAGLLASSDLELDRRFREMIAEVHGVDLRQPPSGPPPETVAVWADPDVAERRRGLAFIAPLLPGKVEAGRAFAREAFEERVEEFAESRRDLGQNIHQTRTIQCILIGGTTRLSPASSFGIRCGF